ncbi:MAG: hypothetical protein HYV42_01640 [Candidatus Magasanikbacteria bacterium]|nr:hypothetical protein [Candidatus Magasanikbacteria bacterium]
MLRQNTAGLTLIEVVITLMVISAVFIIFQTSLNVIFLNRRVNHQELALRLVNTKMEQIRALAYETLPPAGSFSDPLLSSLPSATATLTISDYDSATKQVTATVTWQEAAGNAPRSITMTTLVTKGGL